MWKKERTLAACVLAAAWWSIFYPELCFTEETCRVIQTAEEAAEVWDEAAPDRNAGGTGQDEAAPGRNAGGTGQDEAAPGRNVDEAGKNAPMQSGTEVSGILQADEDEVVVSSRLLEWCEEKLLDGKK